MTSLPSKLIRLPDSPPRAFVVRRTGIINSESNDVACGFEHVSSSTNVKDDSKIADMKAVHAINVNEKCESGKDRHDSQSLHFNAQSTNDQVNGDKPKKCDPQLLLQKFDAVNTDESDTIMVQPRIDSNDEMNAEVIQPRVDSDIRNSEDKLTVNVDENVEVDEEYEQVLIDRRRLLSDEANRQRIRSELESYVGSLKSLTDEDGEQLVQFPRNYQQVVSLMTQKDISEEAKAFKEGEQTRQSWSRVLINSGLSKQQAFGLVEEVDDDAEGSKDLAAKIALKMARIRQLDAILEKKLGKNLYANIVVSKQVSVQCKESKEGVTTLNKSLMMQAQPATSLTGGQSSRSSIGIEDRPKKDNNFIERNKQVVANGMKGNMTKEEEERLEKLLCDDVSLRDDPNDEVNIKEEAEGSHEECIEYTMSHDEKLAIEKLISTQSVNYPLYAIDESSVDDALSGNVIQETKRERLQRQRLSRVEQELRFLQECPSVIIVGDDRDEDEQDDCRSEQSFATATSSACSTRSGVISRHDFKRFLAQQKDKYNATPTASADEIRQLLLTISHDVVGATSG